MVLRGIEQKIEALFEGVFGRAFRTNVQPVELARKLSKEMDEHRVVSVSRVYVPNEYTIYLSPGDREQFEGYENSLLAELEEYLTEHARRESYALLTPPRVLLETDDDLALGEFGIATRMVQPRHGARGDEPEEEVESGATMIYKPRSPQADRGRVARGARPRARGRRPLVGGPPAAGRQAPRRARPLARVRHPDRGRERLPPPRRAPPGGRRLLDRRPRLDERDRGERTAREAREARAGRHASRSARPR